MTFDLTGKRVWVAGHRGMVGGAVVRRLAGEDCEVVTAGRDEVDLVDQAAVRDWMKRSRPDAIVLAAAKVGGIKANADFPVDFLYQNLMIEANILQAAHEADVARLLFLGSSCIYPKLAPQPIREDALLTGPLEPTNEGYAIAKIAGVKLTQAYRKQYGRDWISAMPTNLYGPGDNYDPEVRATSCPRFCASSRRQRRRRPQRSFSGAPARPCANSCIVTIWPMPWCSCSRHIPAMSM